MGKENIKHLFWAVPLGIWILGFIESLFANAINGKVYEDIAWFFGGPTYYWNYLHPDPNNSPEDIHYLAFILLCWILIGLWIVGVYVVATSIMLKIGWLRAEQQYPSLIANGELAAALAKIKMDQPNITGVEMVSVKKWMDEYVSGIAGIFQLQKGEYRAYWLVGQQGSNGNEYIAVMDLAVPDLSLNDTKIIKKALDDDSLQNYKDYINPKRYPQYGVKSYFFVRDEHFKLAFIIFIEKEGVITKRALKEFEFATSSFYLLGALDKLLKIMVESIKDE